MLNRNERLVQRKAGVQNAPLSSDLMSQVQWEKRSMNVLHVFRNIR
ncbi:MAG: hypothetical protein WCC82_01230 [Nitrososphaeraceae archaeon]